MKIYDFFCHTAFLLLLTDINKAEDYYITPD